MMAYCTRQDIETQFGSADVTTWADKNNNRDATEIATAIADAIAIADQYIDDSLRGGLVAVPFSTVPTMIRVISRRLAGCELYESRGAQDFDSEGESIDRLAGMRSRCEKMLGKIRTGAMLLGVDDMCPRYPQVVPTTMNTESDLLTEDGQWQV